MNNNKTYSFSYSKISTYLECPKKYELQIIRNLILFKENIYTAFGSAIHKAIQLVIEKKYDIDEAYIIFEKNLRENIRKIDPKDAQLIFINEWVRKGKPIIEYFFSDYYDKIKTGEIEVLGVEKYFKYEIRPNIFYNGIIDFLIKHNCVTENTIKMPITKILKNGKQKTVFQNITNKQLKTYYKILDWKTGAIKPKENLQLLSYTIPLLYLDQILINKIDYIYLKHKKDISFDVSIDKINETKKYLNSVINNIMIDTETNNFKMCLDKNICKYCNVRKFCDKDFELSLDNQENLKICEIRDDNISNKNAKEKVI